MSETFDDALQAAKRLSAFIEENQTKDLEFVEKVVSKEGVAQGGLSNPMDLDDLLNELAEKSEEEKEETKGEGNNLKPEDVDGDFDLDDTEADDDDDIQDLNFRGTTGGTHATNDFETKTVDSLAEKLEELRHQRNNLLIETDWRAGSDLTMSDDMKTYRQALRDRFTDKTRMSELDAWPTPPS